MPQNPYLQALQGLNYNRALPGSALAGPDDFTQPATISVTRGSDIDPGATSQIDPAVAAYVLKQKRAGELMDPRFLGSPTAARTGADLAGDIASSPITAQRPQVDAINKANQQAMLAGFLGAKPTRTGTDPGGTPFYSAEAQAPAAQEALAGRQAAYAKAQAPIEEARIKAGGELAVAKTRAQQLAEQNQMLMNLFRGQQGPGGVSGGPGLTPGTELSIGGARVKVPQAEPAAATAADAKELADVRQKIAALQTQGPMQQLGNYLGGRPTSERLTLLNQRKTELEGRISGKPAVGATPGGQPVDMIAPDGRELSVPQEKVQELLTAGARLK